MPGEVNEVDFLEWEETFFEKIDFYEEVMRNLEMVKDLEMMKNFEVKNFLSVGQKEEGYVFRNSSFHSLYSRLLSFPKLFTSIDQVGFSRAT